MNLKSKILIAAPLLLSLQAGASNWVKVSVDESGVFSIPYSELTAMGFSDPSAVGVVGRGGVSLPISNVLSSSTELSKVPVLHENNALFFYGNGPDNYSFVRDTDLRNAGAFHNDGINIYTNYGYYYLTDDPGMLLEVSAKEIGSAEAKELQWGVAFQAHENELYYNTTDTGNVFWGERFNNGEPSERKWLLELDDAVNSSPAYFDFSFYTERNEEGSFSFGTETSGTTEISNCVSTTTNYNPLPNTAGDISVAKGKNVLSLKYTSASNTHGVANLDYWVLSYRTDLENGEILTGRPIAFPLVTESSNGEFQSSNKNLKGFDISERMNPTLVTQNDGKFNLSFGNSTPVVVFFDSTTPQKEISAWERTDDMTSSQLHSQAASGVELLIIYTKDMLPYAEQIANLHREIDGMKVLTTEISQVYNEYSEGLPDKEAYRRLAMQFYNSGNHSLKNILLIGPYANDVRGISNPRAYASVHIAPQAPSIHYERGAYPATDYYANFSDDVSLERVEFAPLSIGIGVLPFYNSKDAETYITKLERYMREPNHSYTANEWLYIGGTGDDHTHDKQCVDLEQQVYNATNGSIIGSMVALDAYGSDEARNKVIEYLETGKNFIVYFGHSGNNMFDKDSKFFSSADISNLNNNHLPFLLTAGCSTTGTDHCVRGISEEWVMKSEYGAIGALGTLRETWSSQNFDLVRNMLSFITTNEEFDGLSIGEIFFETKNRVNNVNDLSFLLICDPALKIPFPRNQVQIDLVEALAPGEKLTLKGSVKKADGSDDSSFNGTVVVKLAEPEKTLVSDDFNSKSKDNGITLNVSYRDKITTVTAGEVKNGKFSVDLVVPDNMETFKGQFAPVYITCYDPQRDLSVVGSVREMLNEKSAGGEGSSKDILAPVFENFEYSADSSSIYFTVSDDTAVSITQSSYPKGTSVWIDGKTYQGISAIPVEITDNGKKATFKVTVPTLQEGSHTFAAEVSDPAGNKTKSEFAFSTSGDDNFIALALEETAVADKASFNVNGNGGSQCELVILSATGNVIRKIDFTGSSVEWDRRDSSGNKVSAGLYKAAVREKSSGTSAGPLHYSKTIEVPAI